MKKTTTNVTQKTRFCNTPHPRGGAHTKIKAKVNKTGDTMKTWVNIDTNMIGGTCKARDFPAQIAHLKEHLRI